jgi:hypothetical protein
MVARAHSSPHDGNPSPSEYSRLHIGIYQIGKYGIFPIMIVTGKHVFERPDLDRSARARIALWCQEIKLGRWRSIEELCEAKIPHEQLGPNRVRFFLRACGVYVDALVRFEAPAIVCVVDVVRIEGNTNA